MERNIYHIPTKMLIHNVLAIFILSLAVHCTYAQLDYSLWESWSAWSTCTGDCNAAFHNRTRTCNGDVCVGIDQETHKCLPSVKIDDCARVKLNADNIAYLVSCEDSAEYYQCEKEENGHYTLSLRMCDDDTVWDQTELACVGNPSGMPSSTNATAKSTAQTQQKPEMCLNFETMTEANKLGFTEKGICIGNHGKNWESEHVQMSFSDCIEGRKCAYFSGESYLSINNLANYFHTWKTFTINLWHKPSHLGTMGLLTNGLASTGCCSSPTVSITTTNGQLNIHVALKDRTAQLKGRVVLNKWNHVSLMKDNDTISMYVNGEMSDQQELKGDLLPSLCPMMIGIGRNQAFFQGQMDKICIYKEALTQQQVSGEYGMMMPNGA